MIGRCFILLLISAEAYAQTYTGTRFQAMGGTGTALQEIHSLTANPAGLTALVHTTSHIAHRYHFVATDITSQTALLGVPTSLGSFGILLHRYGLQNTYREMQGGLAYAKSFGPRLSLAIKINAHQLAISNYGSTGAFSADVGLQYSVLPELLVGVHYLNVGGLNYDDRHGTIPSSIRLGACYRLDKVIVTSDLKYNTTNPVSGAVGLEYAIVPILLMRGGLSFLPLAQHAGFGLIWGHMAFDMAASFHRYLGMSPQFGLSYAF